MGMEILGTTQAQATGAEAQVNKPVNQGGTAPAPVVTASVQPAAKLPGDAEENQGQNAKNGKDGQATDKQIQAAIEHVKKASANSRTRCEFSYHEKTKRVSIKVLDEATNEVIKEIPPEKSLEMVEKMWELAGILVDEKR